MMRGKIHLTVIENNSKHTIETYDGEYKNLMFLLRDKIYLDDFGECGGMGRCATCIIKIIGLTGISTAKERNEPVTLSKIGFVDENIRLSCQLLVTKDLNNTEIELIEL
ncbi:MULTISPECIES: 2Fe-2S iron-sulfur cluster-binding protein [unclassified Flavobacterium]|jgi:2Fe-2S ferredoxin|uniref:2Fe-2S iron-sulfur cluster-binding protein n=2 Tax=unclassified Flavobacterium TaxID=196869 RepID=UPI0025B85F62|nr:MULTISPECIES: 2Fe-2S iron-sulfur cluster-binding protein [unclassified Flavobacterium]